MASDDSLTLADGRTRYFTANGIAPDGGYDADWVRFKVGPFPVSFPNTEGRKRGVRYHDLNHVVTGYGTDLRGEAEIGAWELASGCTRFPIVVLLNLLVIWPVLFLSPVRLWRAFLRGRHSMNLYAEHYDQALLDRTIGPTRQALGLDHEPAASAADVVSFGGLVLVVVGLQALILLALVAPVAALVLWLG